MLKVAQVKMKTGEYKWGIVDGATGKCVRNPHGPGWATYSSKERAEQDVEAAMMVRERENF